MIGPANKSGHSLIELMVVVAIVTILAVAAVPAYRSSMLRAHRVEATAALLALAAAQEQFYLQQNTYATDLEASPPDGLGLPAITERGYYIVAIESADNAGFVATASATGSQAPDTQCASFSLDAAGARTATNADCWSR